MHIILFIMIAALVIEQLCINILYSKFDFIVNTFGNLFGAIFYIGGFAAITLSILIVYKGIKNKEFKLHKWDICFILLMIWGLFSVIFSEDKQLTIIGSNYRMDGYLSYIIYASFYIGARTLKSEKIRLWILRTLAFATTSLCFDFILGKSIVSIFNNQNHFAYLLTISCLLLCGLFLYESKIILKLLYLIMFGINVYTLIYVDTFGSYLAVLFGMILSVILVCFAKQEKQIIISSIIALFIFIAISTTVDTKTHLLRSNFSSLFTDVEKIATDAPDADEAGSLRIMLWKLSFQYIKERPVFGYGPEGPYHAFREDGLGYDRPHNEYIQHALFMGIPAAIFYITGLLLLFLHCIKNRKQLPSYAIISGLAVFAYCISAFFGNTMYYTSPYFFIVLGILSKPSIHVEHK